jgi:hypothetical protein
VIKSEEMRWAGHVAHVGERRGPYLRERGHLEDPSVDVRMILKWIFEKWDEGAWTGLIWLCIGTFGGLL